MRLIIRKSLRGVKVRKSHETEDQEVPPGMEWEEVFKRRMPSGGTLHIEEIQDQVELQLMRNEEYVVARKYILYREERATERSKDTPKQTNIDAPKIIHNTIADARAVVTEASLSA